MTSRERVRQILEFKIPDRIAIWDSLPDKTLKRWNKKETDFDFDIGKNKFRVFSSSCPFGMAADELTLQKLLEDIAKDPKGISSILKNNTDRIKKEFSRLKDEGTEFDGVWLLGDLAYNKGPLFSPEFYKKEIFPLHKELCSFFENFKLQTIYHSDGNIKGYIHTFIKAGFRALHPLQSGCGLDIEKLKKEYGKDIVFFGNIAISAFEAGRNNIEQEVKKKIDTAKQGGGYIYSADGPIPESVKLEDYQFALELIKKTGRY